MQYIKTIISALLIVLCLTGCASKAPSPEPDIGATLSAVYRAGDFSYSCNISVTEKDVSVMPTSTNAAGLLITFDGKTVTFDKNGMVKAFARDVIDSTNPAVVLYEVFACLKAQEKGVAVKKGTLYEYTGKISLGTFTLTQNEDGTLNTLSVPDAGISVIF